MKVTNVSFAIECGNTIYILSYLDRKNKWAMIDYKHPAKIIFEKTEVKLKGFKNEKRAKELFREYLLNR